MRPFSIKSVRCHFWSWPWRQPITSPVDLKVISVIFGSKKSPVVSRWVSRGPQPVLKLARSSFASTAELAGFWVSSVTTPVTPEIWPKVVEKPAWLYWNAAALWLGSMS